MSYGRTQTLDEKRDFDEVPFNIQYFNCLGLRFRPKTVDIMLQHTGLCMGNF
jgi:hypothetical protein